MSCAARGSGARYCHTKCPVEASVVHFYEDAVGAGAQGDGDLVGAGGVGSAGLVGVDLLAVEPDADAVVAADAEEGFARGVGLDLGVAVGDGPLVGADL